MRRHPPSKMRTDSGDEDGGNDALQFAVNIAWLPELAGKADRDLPALTRDHPAFCRNLGTEVRALPQFDCRSSRCKSASSFDVHFRPLTGLPNAMQARKTRLGAHDTSKPSKNHLSGVHLRLQSKDTTSSKLTTGNSIWM